MENSNWLDVVVVAIAAIIVLSGLIMLFKGIAVMEDKSTK